MLPDPPRRLDRFAIRAVQLAPAKLWRISRHPSGEPFFGRSASNRFDDPGRPQRRRFGTCYLGLSLEVAIAETVLHDEMPRNGRFEIAATELESRYCVRFAGGTPLVLADLTGAALKTLVGSSELSTIVPYDVPQRWSRALHRHPQRLDGLIYMSRHVNNQRAVVIFDRAAHKLGRPSC
ncbi:MAG: RES family NAD+ phosphorylase [Proteobacteria bacterium]|nr:RES family NAD+ phosphorylase [Pseudomonadota bacterium]